MPYLWGVRVIGASSMGALRAVECQPFGMEAVGTIARWYEQHPQTCDSEVAVLYAKEYPEISTLPLIHFRLLRENHPSLIGGVIMEQIRNPALYETNLGGD